MNFIEKCKAYMDEKEVSQAKLASKIGISESTFSRYLKGTYPTPESIEEKVNAFFEKEEARNSLSSISEIEFAPTNISQTVLNILEYTRLQKIIGIVYGDAGVGKTFTCKEYAKDKTDTIMLTVNPVFASIKPFLKMLAKKLKISSSGSADEILLRIYNALAGGEKCIIIDEAQHLLLNTIETIRNINDITGTPIIFVGNESIYLKMYGKYEKELSRLCSRITMGGGKALLTDMFVRNDIKMIFPDLQADAIGYLLNISRSRHGLRGAVHTYNNAKNNKDLSLEGLKAMADLMGIVA